MQALLLSWKQNGVAWETPRCPFCGFFFPEEKPLQEHFETVHGKKGWKIISINDFRYPGLSFRIMVDFNPGEYHPKFGDHSPL